MTNSKSTKKALLTSMMSILLCFTMLLGTTFAWFTDSVVSANNIIKSGNLDVVLQYKTDWNDDWRDVDADTKIFKEGALYEPGYTEVVFLRVANAGSLALRYNLNLNVYGETTSTNVDGETFSLKDYLEVGYYVQDEFSSGANYADILIPSMFGTKENALKHVTTTKLSADTGIIAADAPVLAGTDTSKVVAIVLTMPETVGNEANHKTDVAAPTIELGIELLATQFTHENDSFGNQYDKDASVVDTYYATTADELIESIEKAGQGDVISFKNDIKIDPASMSNAYGTTGINIKNGQTIDGNGNTLDIQGAGGTWDSGINTTGGIIRNLTITGSFRGIFINHNSTHGEPVVLENVITDGTVYTISCDQGKNQGLRATNCTFKGWTSFAGTLGSATFTDCTFSEGSGYAYCRPYAPTTFVGCEFEAGFKMDPRATVILENCTLDGVAITDANLATLVISNIANATVK